MDELYLVLILKLMINNKMFNNNWRLFKNIIIIIHIHIYFYFNSIGIKVKRKYIFFKGNFTKKILEF